VGFNFPSVSAFSFTATVTVINDICHSSSGQFCIKELEVKSELSASSAVLLLFSRVSGELRARIFPELVQLKDLLMNLSAPTLSVISKCDS
jgi:hypothetical protein